MSMTNIPGKLQAPFLNQLLQKPSVPGGWWTGTAILLVLYCIYEQISFAASRLVSKANGLWQHVPGPVCVASMTGMLCRHRAGFKSVRGPQYAVPLVGCVIAMVKNPYQFWEDQRKYV